MDSRLPGYADRIADNVPHYFPKGYDFFTHAESINLGDLVAERMTMPEQSATENQISAPLPLKHPFLNQSQAHGQVLLGASRG